MSISYLHIIPVLSGLLMSIGSVVLWRQIAGRVGRNIALVSLSSGIWALFLFVEYYLENSLIANPSAINAGETFQLIKLFSTLAGIAGEMIPFFFLNFALGFPPVSESYRKYATACLTTGAFFSLLAYFGINMTFSGGKIVRESTQTMNVQFLAFCVATLIALVVFIKKHKNYLSYLRRQQLRVFPIGVLVASVGGISTFIWPEYKSIVLIASVSPTLFYAVLGAALLFGRRIFAGKRYIEPSVAHVVKDQEIRRTVLNKVGVDYTLYQKESADGSYRELKGKDRIDLPEVVEYALRKHGVVFWEDFDDNPHAEAYRFMRKNYAQSVLYLIREDQEHVVLIHSIGDDIISRESLKFLEPVLI